MSPLTRIRDLQSFAPRQRSGLVKSDSDACNSFEEPEDKQQQQQQQSPMPLPPLRDANCNSNSTITTDVITTSTASPCSTFLPPSNILPIATNMSASSTTNTTGVHDNNPCSSGNPSNIHHQQPLDYGRTNNHLQQQNGNWEKANGNQNENYHYPSGTTDRPSPPPPPSSSAVGGSNEEIPPPAVSSPWRRSWDMESNAQSDGGTTTSGSYMVDGDEISSVYSSNTFIV